MMKIINASSNKPPAIEPPMMPPSAPGDKPIAAVAVTMAAAGAADVAPMPGAGAGAGGIEAGTKTLTHTAFL